MNVHVWLKNRVTIGNTNSFAHISKCVVHTAVCQPLYKCACAAKAVFYWFMVFFSPPKADALLQSCTCFYISSTVESWQTLLLAPESLICFLRQAPSSPSLSLCFFTMEAHLCPWAFPGPAQSCNRCFFQRIQGTFLELFPTLRNQGRNYC